MSVTRTLLAVTLLITLTSATTGELNADNQSSSRLTITDGYNTLGAYDIRYGYATGWTSKGFSWDFLVDDIVGCQFSDIQSIEIYYNTSWSGYQDDWFDINVWNGSNWFVIKDYGGLLIPPPPPPPSSWTDEYVGNVTDYFSSIDSINDMEISINLTDVIQFPDNPTVNIDGWKVEIIYTCPVCDTVTAPLYCFLLGSYYMPTYMICLSSDISYFCIDRGESVGLRWICNVIT